MRLVAHSHLLVVSLQTTLILTRAPSCSVAGEQAITAGAWQRIRSLINWHSGPPAEMVLVEGISLTRIARRANINTICSHFAAMMMLLAGVIAGIVAVTQAQRKSPCNTPSGWWGGKPIRAAARSCPCGVN